MEGPRAKGFSLWLMPEGAPRERLAGWIDRLADRHRSERFPPHVTLLAGVRGPRHDVLSRAAAAAARLAPLDLRLGGIDGRDEHFRCLFARVTPSGPLLAAHEAAAHAFASEREPAYLPHLSLLYGVLPAEEKQRLAREIGGEVDLRFQVRRLHVWSTEGPVAEWYEVGGLALGRR
jgi:hypothetical protein